jgi:hypothetical protein
VTVRRLTFYAYLAAIAVSVILYAVGFAVNSYGTMLAGVTLWMVNIMVGMEMRRTKIPRNLAQGREPQ